MEEFYYIGSIDQFYGFRIVRHEGCTCSQCRNRTAREALEDPRLMLVLEPRASGPGEVLIHARRASIRVDHVEF